MGDNPAATPPAVVTSGAPPDLWKMFWESLPPHIKSASQSVQIAFMRRLMAQYQENVSAGITPSTGPLVIVAEYRKHVMKHYVPKHPDMRTLSPEHFHKDFLAILSGAKELEEIHPLVFRLRVFTEEWCRKMFEEIHSFESWVAKEGLHLNRPNSMNNYGWILDDFGFDAMLQQLSTTYMRRLAAVAFPHCGGATLDSHHGFIVDYEMGKDVDLGFHVDDSEITLNLCMGHAFEGGGLYFKGRRCRKHQQSKSVPAEDFVYNHEPGVAVLHLGKHRHGARPITAGHRTNLILWCRSSSYRATLDDNTCTEWCGVSDPSAGSMGSVVVSPVVSVRGSGAGVDPASRTPSLVMGTGGAGAGAGSGMHSPLAVSSP